MDILNKSLQEFWNDQFENLRLHKISYRWEQLMDPMMNENTFVKDIKDSLITIYVSHPIWKQHIFMQKQRLLFALNQELGNGKLQDMDLQLISYDKIKKLKEEREAIKREIENSLPQDETIPFDRIHLSEAAMAAIDEKASKIENIPLRNVLKKIREQQQKKEIYLKEQGYHRCPVCQHMIQEQYCFFCEQEKEKQVRGKIRAAIEEKPWLSYQEFFEIQPCRFEVFREVKKQVVATYSDLIFKGSTDWTILCMYTMLVTGKSNTEIDQDLVLKRTERLRNSYVQFAEKYKNTSKS